MRIIVMHSGDAQTTARNHFKRNKGTYIKIGCMSAAAFLAMAGVAEASSLDASGHRIYAKIRNIGYWIILIKGAIEIIQDVTQGDYASAKKHCVAYMMVYGTLWLLPWGMKQVEEMFAGGI